MFLYIAQSKYNSERLALKLSLQHSLCLSVSEPNRHKDWQSLFNLHRKRECIDNIEWESMFLYIAQPKHNSERHALTLPLQHHFLDCISQLHHIQQPQWDCHWLPF